MSCRIKVSASVESLCASANSRYLDVAVLYKIVEYAEEQSNVEHQPFRALFVAYESVLPQHGIKTAHDRIYLRFLFRLGQKRRQEESLFESFERLLEELGIQLEFKDDASASQAQDEVVQDSENVEFKDNSPRGRRRASLSAIFAEAEETTNDIKDTNHGRAVSQEAPLHSSRRHTKRPWPPSSAKPTDELVVHSHRSKGENEPSHLTRSLDGRDDETREGPFVVEGAVTQESRETHPFEQSPSQPSTPPQRKFVATVPVAAYPHIYRPSRSQLFRDAETFQHYRIRAVVRDIIDRWCDAALTSHEHHEHLLRLAAAQDTEVLVRQAFVHWRARLHARSSAAATDNYFAHLEKRALRARDLYLLTKALTHWAQSAMDEKRQRFVARQRILAVKYFHAWHDMTIQNQEKQDLRLSKKWVGVWKHQYITNLTSDYNADWFYERRTIRNGYWHWFWSFCERRAPEWHARKLKQRCLVTWLKQYRTHRKQVLRVARDKDARIAKASFLQWSAKTDTCLENEKKMIALRHRNIVSLAMQTWSRELQFLPLNHRMSNMADWRIAGTTFATFVNKFRSEKQADKLNYLRMLRNICHNWNDHLRQRTHSHRIDHRFVLTALYRWVVATRYSLLKRLFNEREKVRYFRLWRRTHLEQRDSLAHSLVLWEARDRQVFLRDAFVSWRSQSRDHHRAMQISHEFHAPKLAVETLMLWKNALKAKQLISEGADDARYFFLVRRVLRLWKKRTQESKRQKRRDAYAVIRRRTKMRIASQALQTWRGRTTQNAGQMMLAEDFQQKQIFRTGNSLFDKWKREVMGLLDKDLEAAGYLQQALLGRFLTLWINQTEHLWEQEETAIANLDLRVQKTAFLCLRRLRLRLIELRSQQGKGEVLRINHEKQHQRSLMYGWRDKTPSYQKRISATPQRPGKSRVFRRYREAEDMGATKRAEEWTELDTGAWAPFMEAQATSTPLPGYLSTPSKRASRAKAIVQSTTPLGTPLQSRLRAQLNTTPRSTRFGAFGKSRLGVAPFGSVLEESPLVPGSEEAENDE